MPQLKRPTSNNASRRTAIVWNLWFSFILEIEAITLSLLNETLRAWRGAERVPAGLLALDALNLPTAASPVEREIRLRELVESVVMEELARQRAAEGLPAAGQARAELSAAIGGDFGRHNAQLEAWSALYHRYLAPVPFSVEELAATAHLDVRNFRRRVNNGVDRLVAHLRRLERDAHHQARAARLGRHLPPREFAQLFGVAGQQRAIADLLRAADGPEFISIEGLGGIGKTALARAVAGELVDDGELDGIAWISARQTWLNDRGLIETAPDPATTLADIVNRLTFQLGFTELAGLATGEKLNRLASFLKGARHLIVIDNLESVSDVDTLLPALMPLARPTRFLLTSRHTMSRYPTVFCRPVKSLSLEDSRALVESELDRAGRTASLQPKEMAALYDVVGGAPLALKLVTAQLGHWPLSVLLEDLRLAGRRAPQHLYTFIYRRAWQNLDEDARQLLLSLLTIAPDGEDVDWLRLMSFLPPDAFDAALAQLLAYSLLQLAGRPGSPRYRLHRLTATFLQTQILLGWDDAEPPAADPEAN